MPDQKKNRNSGGNRNISILISAVMCALMLLFAYRSMISMTRSANSEEITYGQFRQMIVDGEVEAVELTATRYIIYPKTEEPQGSAAPAETPAPTPDPNTLQGQLQLQLPPLEELNQSPQKTYY